MNARTRYLLAALCAGLAGVLTLFFLGGIGAARESDAEVIWVARQAIPPGIRLSEEMLQRVRVDGPTRRLLARTALPTAATDAPDQWYAAAPIAPGQALTPGGNVSREPAPVTPDGAPLSDLRVLTLPVDELPAGLPRVGEEVDLYVIPAKGGDAARILSQTRVILAEEGLIAVLVPEALVTPVLTASDGVPVKVVRRLQGLAP